MSAVGETVEVGSHASEVEDAGDPRFTMGLISDALALLKSHGYQMRDDHRTLGATVSALYNLTEIYEGRR